jgi:sulfur-oxidizing protein SoxA
MRARACAAALAALAAVALPAAVAAQTPDQVKRGIDQYRQMLLDGNPSELYALKGAELWTTRRGPRNASLEQCDLGLGPGVIKGAYAQLPRYFADTGRVQDLESRLITCMTALQGFAESEVRRRPMGNEDRPSEMEQLVAFVVTESNGVKMNVRLDHPKMKESFALGRDIFYYRSGAWDFSCATCHSEDDKRIRLQDLPNLTRRQGAQVAYTTWPAYRVSSSQMKTFQWRLNDCFRQMRFPEPAYASEATIALTTYLAAMANGAEYKGPGIKR